jgi:glutamate formiminotransferase/formiminotetrahydrofolate cyclodeaminase
MDAFALAKNSPEEKAARTAAIEEATKHAAEVPLKVMETAAKSYELLSEMADNGNPASVSDVGVGALATRACIEGAAMNVRINLGQLKDEKFKIHLQERVEKVSADSETQFKKINQVVESKLVEASRQVTLAVMLSEAKHLWISTHERLIRDSSLRSE